MAEENGLPGDQSCSKYFDDSAEKEEAAFHIGSLMLSASLLLAGIAWLSVNFASSDTREQLKAACASQLNPSTGADPLDFSNT